MSPLKDHVNESVEQIRRPITFDPSGGFLLVSGGLEGVPCLGSICASDVGNLQTFGVDSRSGGLTPVTQNPQITRDQTGVTVAPGASGVIYTPTFAFTANQGPQPFQPQGTVSEFALGSGGTLSSNPTTISLTASGGLPSAESIAIGPAKLIISGASGGTLHYFPLNVE